MKYFIFIVLLLSSAVFADFSVNEIFSVSYERGDFQITEKPDVNTGVDNFYVTSEHVYFLSSSENTIYQYTLADKKLVTKIDIPPFAMDIAVHNGAIFILGTDNKLHILRQRQISSHKIATSFAQNLQLIEGMPVVHLANGMTYNLATDKDQQRKGWQFAKNLFVYTEKISAHMGKVTVNTNGNIQIFDVPTDKELGSILAVGANETQIFIRLEIMESSSPIQVSQQIICIDTTNRNERTVTNIPNIQSNFNYNDCKYIDGQLVKMMLTPSGIDMVALEANKDGDSWKYDYSYDYNNHLLQIQEVSDQEEIEEPKKRISRSQIVWNAEAFLGVSWSCSSKNKTSGLKTLPDGSKIRTPSWVTSGYHYKVPYKWGGFSSVYTFEQKASQGKYAGSDYTKSVSWGDNHCVGVDCSGFVSRAWATSKKYGTSTIGQVSTQLSSVSKLKKGDALNKRGSHIVLVVENNPSGTVNVIEAAGIDWAVSKRTRRLSSMSSYKPIYFNNVSEW